MPDESRITLNRLGEYYLEMLRQEAFIMNGPMATQATSLIRNFLNQRTAARDRKLEFLAWRRGITVGELKRRIGTGEAQFMSQAEYTEFQAKFGNEEENGG